MATKFGKCIDSFFSKDFPEAEAALADWIAHLDHCEFFGPDDPLFPATAIKASPSTGFAADGFKRQSWASGQPIREIVKAAFERAVLPNYGPHAFRHMLARHAVKNASSVAEIVAHSQNLGHADTYTTLRSYGQISREQQRALVTGEKPLSD